MWWRWDRRQWQGSLILEENILRLGQALATTVQSERRAERPVAYSHVNSDGLVSNLDIGGRRLSPVNLFVDVLLVICVAPNAVHLHRLCLYHTSNKILGPNNVFFRRFVVGVQ